MGEVCPISSNTLSIWDGNTFTPLIINISSVRPVTLLILTIVLPVTLVIIK